MTPVQQGPILSLRVDSQTTIWRDGEIVRVDAFGRVEFRKPVAAVVEPKEKPKAKDAT